MHGTLFFYRRVLYTVYKIFIFFLGSVYKQILRLHTETPVFLCKQTYVLQKTLFCLYFPAALWYTVVRNNFNGIEKRKRNTEKKHETHN